MTLDQTTPMHEIRGPTAGQPVDERAPPPSLRWWILAKQTTLALLLVASFLVFYLFGALIEALSLL